MKDYSISEKIIYLSLIDILFLPRISYPVWMQLSLIPMFFIQLHNKFRIKDIALYAIFSLALFASLLNSVELYGYFNFNQNFKRTFQLMFVFVYIFPNLRVDLEIIRLILKFFYIWIGFLVVIYWINPSAVSNYLIYFYPESIYIEEFNLDGLRFSYIFQDPNSAGYFFVMAFALYLGIKADDFSKSSALILFSCIIAVVSTQSRGALISLVGIYLFFLFEKGRINILYFVMLTAISIMILFGIDNYTPIFDLITDRNSQDFGESRVDKYLYFFNNINYLPYGVGYELTIGGVEFRPHSDLIRMILSYGFIAFTYLAVKCYPVNEEQKRLFIPAMVAFMINSLIFDFRMFGFYLLSLTILKYKKQSAI